MGKTKGAAVKPMKMPKLGQYIEGPASELDYPRSIHLMGPQGQGKSTLAATICRVPGFKKVRLVDFDFGSSGIAADYPEINVTTFRRGDIDAFDRWFAQYVKNDCEDDDACIFDTVTKGQRWFRKATVIKGHPDTRGQWGEVGEWTIDLAEEAAAMRALGILNFHVQEGNTMKGTEDTDLRRIVPALQGASAMTVGASADIVGLCHTVDLDEDDEDYTPESPLEYQVILQPTDTTLTKNRFKLPPVLNAAGGMPRIYELIEARSKKGTK